MVSHFLEQFRLNAEAVPNALAIVDRDMMRWTYRTIATSSAFLQGALRDSTKGHQVIGIFLPPGGAFFASVFAALELGAVVPLAYDDDSADQLNFVERLGLSGIICDEAATDSAVVEAARCPSTVLSSPVKATPGRGMRKTTSDVARCIRLERRSLLVRTSGTTGTSKLVVHGLAGLTAAAQQAARAFRLARTDRCVTPMPLHHTHGLVGCGLSTLITGGALILAPLHGATITAVAGEYAATWFSASPPLLHSLLFAGGSPGASPISWRFIRSGAGPLPLGLAQQLNVRFGCDIVNTYALTEVPGVVTATPMARGHTPDDTVGFPSGCLVEIVDDDGEVVNVLQEGEVVVDAPHMFVGYVTFDDGEKVTFQPHVGRFHTGDVGVIDERGCLSIVGRLKELICVAGENVSPIEVENVIGLHPAIVDAACFGIPDATVGEAIGLAVVSRPEGDMTIHDLRAFLRHKLPAPKIPARLWHVRQIPRSSTGKVLRAQLAADCLTERRSLPGTADNHQPL